MSAWKRVRNERGAILAFVAVALAVLLGGAGLALDSGRAYLVRAELSRAADAGVLAGARALRDGELTARRRATAVAELNGAGRPGTDLSVGFGVNAEGERTVHVSAGWTMPTLFMRVLGIDEMPIRAAATAAIPPVDLVLVLDQSGSLEDLGAFDDLQDASNEFVGHFDDKIDQMGLVSFQLRGTKRFGLNSAFTADVRNAIDQMKSAGDTNVGEGLRIAHGELTGVTVRERSAKVVVFFTDGRPTAFRGSVGGFPDAAVAVPRGSNNRVRGLWSKPDQLPTDVVARNPDDCGNKPSCYGWTPGQVRKQSREVGLQQAAALRAEGIYVYAIGMGNPAAKNPLEVPDIDYLREIANEGGMVDRGQPQGKAYFAPSKNELRQVFTQVATDLLVRLSQ